MPCAPACIGADPYGAPCGGCCCHCGGCIWCGMESGILPGKDDTYSDDEEDYPSPRHRAGQAADAVGVSVSVATGSGNVNSKAANDDQLAADFERQRLEAEQEAAMLESRHMSGLSAQGALVTSSAL